MLNTAPQAAAFWTALLLMLMVVLSALVVRQRRAHRVGLGDGDGGQPSLQQASRAFGNAAEYIPAGIAVLILLAQLRSSFMLIHLLGLMLFVGRLVHGVAITGNRGITAGRIAGMVLTWAAYLIAAVTLLLYAFA